jgi:hypothetical protein
VVDANGATVSSEAELMAASARLSWPLARGYLAVSAQDLMAADTTAARVIHGSATSVTSSRHRMWSHTKKPSHPSSSPLLLGGQQS